MKEINESEFAGVTVKGAVLIDFGAEWCGPCKAMLPVLEKLSADYQGRLEIYSVDIDKDPTLAAKHGVMSVPTFLLFKDGKAVERVVGAMPEREMKKRIDPHVG
ncbi:MAG: thioredoxin [Thermoanaerobaculia bacterium]